MLHFVKFHRFHSITSLVLISLHLFIFITACLFQDKSIHICIYFFWFKYIKAAFYPPILQRESNVGYIIIKILNTLRGFHTSISRWSFTGVWVTANPFKSPGLISVFWTIIIRLYFQWFPHVLFFQNFPVPFLILYWLYRARQIQLIWPSLSCSIVFSVP